MAREVTDLKGKPTTVMFLNQYFLSNHILNIYSLYPQINVALVPHQRSFFFQWIETTRDPQLAKRS